MIKTVISPDRILSKIMLKSMANIPLASLDSDHYLIVIVFVNKKNALSNSEDQRENANIQIHNNSQKVKHKVFKELKLF